MPNGLPQRPTSALFPAQPQPAPETRRVPPELEAFRQSVAGQVGEFSSRIRLVEQRVENLRRHLELIDSSLIEKHKTVVAEIRDVQDGMRSLRADIEFTKDLAERVAKRLEDLASREEVKVLQRYVEYWQPLSFVTRSEVRSLVENILKEHNVKIKKKEE
jgi:hypothetical protein